MDLFSAQVAFFLCCRASSRCRLSVWVGLASDDGFVRCRCWLEGCSIGSFTTAKDREVGKVTMRVVAFAPSLSAVSLDAGGITAEGFPMTSCYVDRFPTQITIPIVVAVCTNGGADYEARKYIVATSPEDERVGSLEFGWQWPDNPPSAVKFRVFAQHLPMRVQSAGTYTLGLYDSLEATYTEHLFPLPVFKRNPLIQTLTQN